MAKIRVFMKRLADVEVNPQRSNQHEFNAGGIRRELGFGHDRTRGEVEIHFYKEDGAEPVAVSGGHTLYDARRNDPRRSEWRMYYDMRLAEHARVDDLMLLFRPDPTNAKLIAVIARKGTLVERALTTRLAGCEPDELGDKLFVDSRAVDPDTYRLLLGAVHGPVAPPAVTDAAVQSHRVFQDSVASGHMPGTREMAGAAQEIIASLGVTASAPDDFIHSALAAETALFMCIEKELGERRLAQLVEDGRLDFHNVMGICTSFSQRRRNRRGRSLENHFRRLLEDLGMPYGYQCTTEAGRTPDFIFPACQDYHDSGFPSEFLRMVGCKTVVRERYTQWLEEADRVALKYALCVDPGLSDRVVHRYRDRLRFFVPRQLLVEKYADRTISGLLGSVADLIGELRAAAARGGPA